MRNIFQSKLLVFAFLFLLLGCAPRFKKFSKLQDDPHGFVQHRNSPSGNAHIDQIVPPIDTLLYKHKLNGGISAQVVGTRQFLIVPTLNKRIYFLNPKNGKELTSIITESSVGSAAAVIDALLYYVEEPIGNQITCLNLINGKHVWNMSLNDPQGPPIIDGDYLYVTSGDGIISRVNRFSGSVDWQLETKARIYSSPVLDSTQVYIGNDQGTLIALDKETGQESWKYETGSTIFTSPAITDKVYLGSAGGILTAIEKKTGTEVWRFISGGQIHTTPVIAAGRVFFGSNDRTLYCLDSYNGQILWSYETNGIIHSSPVLLGDKIACANSAGSIYLFDTKGVITQTFQVKGSVTAPLAYIDGRLIVATRKRMLYSFGSTYIHRYQPFNSAKQAE